MLSTIDSEEVVFKVKVDLTRSRQQALWALVGYFPDIIREVADAMPKGRRSEVEIVLFKPNLSKYGGRIFDDSLEEEYRQRGLKPVDPFSLAALNEAEPTLALMKFHATHWKDRDGNWCHMALYLRDRENWVSIGHPSSIWRGWPDNMWFAGIRNK